MMGFQVEDVQAKLVETCSKCSILPSIMRKGTVLLFLLVLGYCFLGGYVFMQLEKDEDLGRLTGAINVSQFVKLKEEAYQRMNKSGSLVLEDVLEEAVRMVQNGSLRLNSQEDVQTRWTFRSSTFFSITVITTIGYGTLSPKTISGRVFCIFYAMFGIPLVFVFLHAIGYRINSFNRRFDRFTYVYVHHQRVVKTIRFLGTLAIGWLLFILLPSLLFSVVEGWSIHESAYFGFITLSTIGFGDFSPEIHMLKYSPGSRILVVLWLFLGLAWLSTTLNALQEALEKHVITDCPEEEEVRHEEKKPFSQSKHEGDIDASDKVMVNDIKLKGKR